MRRLFAGTFAALTAFYALAAYRFYQQERWAREVPGPATLAVERIDHPEAAIGLAREGLSRFRFGSREHDLIRKALLASPAFYEPPFLLATYHAGRRESAETVSKGYELAVERFPVNGRLRLAFGIWLLDGRDDLAVWQAIGDPLPRAEPELREAMALEPELSGTALDALRDARVPPERWATLVSEHPTARAHLLDALLGVDRFDLGLRVVEEALAGDGPSNLQLLRRLTELSLRAERPEVAVEAAERWLARAEGEQGPGEVSFQPAASLFRAHMMRGDEAAADAALAAAQARVEAAHGADSRLAVELLCVMGEEYLRAGRIIAAESLFAEAEARRPSHVPALLGLARAASRARDFDRAEASYRDVLRLDASHAEARRELESLLTRSGGR